MEGRRGGEERKLREGEEMEGRRGGERREERREEREGRGKERKGGVGTSRSKSSWYVAFTAVAIILAKRANVVNDGALNMAIMSGHRLS